MNDKKVLVVVRDCLGIRGGSELLQRGKKERNEALRKLKKKGLSMRQIERLTGIDK